MKLNIVAVVFIIFSGLWSLHGFVSANNDQVNSKLSYVQDICDSARLTGTAHDRAECGAAQDETNTEYLCSTTTNCWVEQK